jgi:hypothetical protein
MASGLTSTRGTGAAKSRRVSSPGPHDHQSSRGVAICQGNDSVRQSKIFLAALVETVRVHLCWICQTSSSTLCGRTEDLMFRAPSNYQFERRCVSARAIRRTFRLGLHGVQSGLKIWADGRLRKLKTFNMWLFQSNILLSERSCQSVVELAVRFFSGNPEEFS